MAQVIDALDLVSNQKRLPTEAFFVDTNIIINYKDPFGSSYKDKRFEKLNEDTTEVLVHLKSLYKAFTTLSVSQEYYKYIQINSYKLYKQTKEFKLQDFKKLRETDISFMNIWEKYLKQFKTVFTKNFKIIDKEFNGEDIIIEFKGSLADFGDHLLFYTMKYEGVNKCIFSNDSDFYSYTDDFFLLTLNKNIINLAKQDKKIYHPSKKH